jgi:hypothetical protein
MRKRGSLRRRGVAPEARTVSVPVRRIVHSSCSPAGHSEGRRISLRTQVIVFKRLTILKHRWHGHCNSQLTDTHYDVRRRLAQPVTPSRKLYPAAYFFKVVT